RSASRGTRPAPPAHNRLEPRLAIPWEPPRQPLDLSSQRRLITPMSPARSPVRARPPHDSAGPALRDPELVAQIIGCGPLLVRGHHFLFAMSWSIGLSGISSATNLFSRPTSRSSSRQPPGAALPTAAGWPPPPG